MDFEEYWNSLASDPADPEMLVMQCRFAAENAWYAAMSIEREECAGICDRFAARDMHPAECAGAIRMRSNTKIGGYSPPHRES